MWDAPQVSAARPSSTRAVRQSTSRVISAPYAAARPGTEATSGSSYWPMSAVYVHGTAPLSRIHATATEVSRPPEKAIPTRSPTGREVRTLDTMQVYAYKRMVMQRFRGSARQGRSVSLRPGRNSRPYAALRPGRRGGPGDLFCWGSQVLPAEPT